MTNCIVIEDDENIIELICDILEIIKIDVLAKGNNGKEAIELYEKHKPDLVFTDLSMPGFDGLYAIENIKAKNPNARIIVITGNPNEDDKYILDLLEIPIIIKPFGINVLKQTIKQISSTRTLPTNPLEIKYKFVDKYDYYTCIVNYEQYMNFRKLPIIQECEIIKKSSKNIE
ncbi:MAG: response regulator [Candidatus Nitrosopumilus sp. bin_6a]